MTGTFQCPVSQRIYSAALLLKTVLPAARIQRLSPQQHLRIRKPLGRHAPLRAAWHLRSEPGTLNRTQVAFAGTSPLTERRGLYAPAQAHSASGNEQEEALNSWSRSARLLPPLQTWGYGARTGRRGGCKGQGFSISRRWQAATSVP